MDQRTVRKRPANEVVVGLSFLIVWILDTVNTVLFFQSELKIAVHAALTKKKLCEVNNFFHFDVFDRRVSFPFKCEKVIFRQSRRAKSPNYPLDINHAHNTDFNKLANFCQVKKFSHIFNHWYFSQSVFIYFFSFVSLPETRCYNPTNKLSLWTLEQKFTTGNMQRFSWSCCVFTFLYLLTNMFLYLN